MGQLTACSSKECCTCGTKGSATSGAQAITVAAPDFLEDEPEPQDAKLVLYFRRRYGRDCDFGYVFEDLFEGRHAVGESKFAEVLSEEVACEFNEASMVFRKLDAGNRGAISAATFESWQDDVEKKEAEGLYAWRDWMRKRYDTPSAAFVAMGKGEGDVLVASEFHSNLHRLGFITTDSLALFRFIDKDMSGEVTFEEFRTAMRSVVLPRVRRKGSRKSTASSLDIATQDAAYPVESEITDQSESSTKDSGPGDKAVRYTADAQKPNNFDFRSKDKRLPSKEVRRSSKEMRRPSKDKESLIAMLRTPSKDSTFSRKPSKDSAGVQIPEAFQGPERSSSKETAKEEPEKEESQEVPVLADAGAES